MSFNRLGFARIDHKLLLHPLSALLHDRQAAPVSHLILAGQSPSWRAGQTPQPIRIVQGDTDVVIALTSNHDRSIARYLNKSIAYREPAPGLPEAILFESRGHGGLLQHCVIPFLGFGRRDVADRLQ